MGLLKWMFDGSYAEKLKAKGDVQGLSRAFRYDQTRPGVRARVAAAKALGEIGGKEALPPLITALHRWDEQPEVRRAAAEALGRIGDAEAVAALLNAVRSEVQPTPAEPSDTARKLLVEIGVRSLAPLIEALARDPHQSSGPSAVRVLKEIGPPAVPELIAALRDPGVPSLVKQTIANALGQMGDPRAVEPLVAALVSPETVVRPAAAIALQRLGERAVPALVAALGETVVDDPNVCIEVLVKVGAAAVGPLVGCLRDSRAGVRDRAVQALGRIGTGEAAEPLAEALEDSGQFASSNVVQALAMMGRPAVDPLLRKLCHPRSDIRRAAALALAAITSGVGESLKQTRSYSYRPLQ
jgi:HEAT repeat protein